MREVLVAAEDGEEGKSTTVFDGLPHFVVLDSTLPIKVIMVTIEDPPHALNQPLSRYSSGLTDIPAPLTKVLTV